MPSSFPKLGEPLTKAKNPYSQTKPKSACDDLSKQALQCLQQVEYRKLEKKPASRAECRHLFDRVRQCRAEEKKELWEKKRQANREARKKRG
mmetsp:Transcript_20890/g.40470  ORF Transcript_20890/g.40470 Transcript_20890/m.40470 type:complete len:92 (+) Transcript_20890:21-296(+)